MAILIDFDQASNQVSFEVINNDPAKEILLKELISKGIDPEVNEDATIYSVNLSKFLSLQSFQDLLVPFHRTEPQWAKEVGLNDYDYLFKSKFGGHEESPSTEGSKPESAHLVSAEELILKAFNSTPTISKGMRP